MNIQSYIIFLLSKEIGPFHGLLSLLLTSCNQGGKRVIAYIPEMVEPEFMYKLFDQVVGNLDDLVKCFWYDGEVKV